ncbi:MAG: hypothetical protein ACR2GW_03905 [Pyrinomonadaceae bacterium]
MIGVGYGVLVGALTFLLTRIGRDPAHPGPLIPDANEMARLVTVLAMLITGICGGLVGLIVGLSGVREGRAAMTGFGFGLLVLALVSMNSWTALANGSWRDWLNLLILLIILPIGLALTAVVVSAVADRLESK